MVASIRGVGFLTALVILAIYLSSLQHIPNGSSHPYMIDVGETQVALNVWGTLHATGYPLYTILGNLFTPLPRLIGFSPAAAASLFSTLWTLLALLSLGMLLARLTGRFWIGAGAVVLLAFMRSIWIHSVIAEVYSLSLALLIGLWWVVMRPLALRDQLWALALLGGISIAHHRALAFGGLGLLLGILPALRAEWRQLPRLLPAALGLFGLGFLPYIYLPLRANAQAEWVYSRDVNTWDGFWFHFWGREADYLVTRPDTLAGWADNLRGTLDILAHEMTLPGFIIALACLVWACWQSPHRRAAHIAALSGLGFFAFAVAYHRAVLPQAIVMMALPSLVLGVALTLDWLAHHRPRWGWAALAGVLLWAGLLIPYQRPFILEHVRDKTGLAAINAAKQVPRGGMEQPVFMLSWGPRYFAASYSRLVTGENADLHMVDHTADFAALAASGATFYTQPDTLYGYPPDWWAARIGAVYPTAAAVDLIRLGTTPRRIDQPDFARFQGQMAQGIWLAGTQITCEKNGISLGVGWYAEKTPPYDYSVKVHLLDAVSDMPLAQADSRAPVFGWRPTSGWVDGELITDFYYLPLHPHAKRIRLGLYQSLPDGGFVDYGETLLALSCPDF